MSPSKKQKLDVDEYINKIKNDENDHVDEYIYKKKPEKSSIALSSYFKSYANNKLEDFYVPIFRALSKEINIKTVLYPGCHRHITPSLFFNDIHYIDIDNKVSNIYYDKKSIKYINDNKEYNSETKINFSNNSYNNIESEKVDLLISLSANIVSEPCEKFIKKNGYLFVNDSHYDASTAYVNNKLKLIKYINDDEYIYNNKYEKKNICFCDKNINDCFHLINGKKINKELVQECIEKNKKIKLKLPKMFYLFQKITD
eukprot:GHVL01016000.1.p1 GENE.GHVL01016000.1~~GHVL01016000.1.p1  ORF type:complete len:257 (+),score=94.29 GHVL01016000.1:61-831(+)